MIQYLIVSMGTQNKVPTIQKYKPELESIFSHFCRPRDGTVPTPGWVRLQSHSVCPLG